MYCTICMYAILKICFREKKNQHRKNMTRISLREIEHNSIPRYNNLFILKSEKLALIVNKIIQINKNNNNFVRLILPLIIFWGIKNIPHVILR